MSPAVTVASVAASLLRQLPTRRLAVLTSRSTGGGVISDLDLGVTDLTVAIRYAVPGDRHVPGDGGRSIEQVEALVDEHGLVGAFDVVVVDPFHTFTMSERTYRLALRLVRPGGILVSHDCAPPLEIALPEQPEEHWWAGVTFAAFREVHEALGLAWCTVDADMGIGMVAVPSTLDHRRLTDPLVEHDPDLVTGHLTRYAQDRIGYMRVVSPDNWEAAIGALRDGLPVDALLASPPEPGAAPPEPVVELPPEIVELLTALGRAEGELAAINRSRIWRSTAWYRRLRTRRSPIAS